MPAFLGCNYGTGSNSIQSVQGEFVSIVDDCLYRGADKSLARPDWKNNWNVAIFRPTREVIAAAETCLDGQPSELFWSGLQK